MLLQIKSYNDYTDELISVMEFLVYKMFWSGC